MSRKNTRHLGVWIILATLLFSPLNGALLAATQVTFNPHFIISDPELQDYQSWTRHDIQLFLESKQSYLASYQSIDINGIAKPASDIIYEAAQRHQINPKFLLVTLQKEQSLITDDAPTEKQLNWATGYAVCDSCSMSDPKVLKYKGFGLQVDNAAGIMRWYYNNSDRSYIKKKDTPQVIDNQQVIPQSWATAFLYTYTPHLHGNKNFDRIWKTWFEQIYPNGTLLTTASTASSTPEVWVLQNGARRKFKNQSVLISRADPKMIITVPEIELSNYPVGAEISFPNYTLLKSPLGTYLLDYDTLRPFASAEVFRQLGFNPDEVVEVTETDLAGLLVGGPIANADAAPQGVIIQITDLANVYYLLKDGMLYPLVDKSLVEVNFRTLAIEKRTREQLKNYPLADVPLRFQDGTLIQVAGSQTVYVIENGKRRRIADDETFVGLGYRRNTLITVSLVTALNMPEGEPLYLNSSLASARNKFLGDITGPVADQFKSPLPAYLIAEYPSGRIISGKNIDDHRPIASLTKLITAYEATHQNFKSAGTTAFSPKTHNAPTNVLKLTAGEKLLNKDILTAALVGSVNNSAQMLATSAGKDPTELLALMRTRLEQWGADNTTIADLTGLDVGNKSTARDLLKIFTKVLAEDELKQILGKTNYSFSGTAGKKKVMHSVKHTNKLNFDSAVNYTILASKTGFTEEAGAVIAMLVETASKKPIPKAIAAKELTTLLKEGQDSAQVKLLQEKLLALGYLPRTTKATGHFGSATLAAVKKFQTAQKLEPLGFVGPGTRTALNRLTGSPTISTPNSDKKQYVIITLGNTDYAKRFAEPNRLAELTTAGKFKLTEERK